MTTRRRELALVCGLTLAAAVLRMADLTGRSMWLDEGYTLARLAGSWLDVLRNIVHLQGQYTIDLHPPVFFLLLKGWSSLAGSGEFPLKLVPAAFGVLVVPATYVLGRRLFSRPVGILAAVMALACPAYEWYSHELRMYSLVTCLAALSTYAAYRATARPRRSMLRWAAWAGIAVVALQTHYAFFGLVAAQLVFFAVSLAARPPRAISRGIVIAVAALATAAGGLVILSGISVSLGTRQVAIDLQSLGDANQSLLGAFRSVMDAALFGLSLSDPTQGLFSWIAALLCLVGGLLPGSPRARLLAVLSGIGAVIIIDFFLIAARWWIDFRYFIVAVPALHVLLARAVIGIWPAPSAARAAVRVARLALAAAILGALTVAAVWGTAQTFVRTPLVQDDWRSMSDYLRQRWQDGDALLVGPFTPDLVLAAYLDGVPIHTLYLHTPDSRQEIEPYNRVWYASTGREKTDPNGALPAALAGYTLREHLFFPGRTDILELSLFERPSPVSDGLPGSATPIQADGAASTHAWLAGFEIGPGWVYNPLPNLRLTLFWRNGHAEGLGNYTVAVRFSDRDGRGWADWFMPAQLEFAPAEWGASQFYRVDYIIPAPVGLPLQTYTMELGVRSGVKPELVQTVRQALGEPETRCCIRITEWPAGGAPGADIWRNSEVALAQDEYRTELKPGEILPVVLTWKRIGPSQGAWETRLSLDGLFAGTVVTSSGITGDGEFPVSAWPAGEPVRDMKSLLVPFSARAGLYRLRLERRLEDGQPGQLTTLGLVELKDYPRTPVPQAVDRPVDAKVGETTLLGYSLQQPFERNTSLEVHTYWRVDADPTRDGVLFVHLIGPDGVKVAQDDNPPEQGKRSTLTYRAGDGIDQIHRMVVPAGAQGGEYKLYAGIYSIGDLVRWPARQDGAPALNDLVYLGALHLPELRRAYLPIALTAATTR